MQTPSIPSLGLKTQKYSELQALNYPTRPSAAVSRNELGVQDPVGFWDPAGASAHQTEGLRARVHQRFRFVSGNPEGPDTELLRN